MGGLIPQVQEMGPRLGAGEDAETPDSGDGPGVGMIPQVQEMGPWLGEGAETPGSGDGPTVGG